MDIGFAFHIKILHVPSREGFKTKTTVTIRGQTIIPAQIRKAHHIAPNTQEVVQVDSSPRDPKAMYTRDNGMAVQGRAIIGRMGSGISTNKVFFTTTPKVHNEKEDA